MPADVWTIVLAAGAGRRLASVTAGAPKQFWRPPGASSTLLDATLERLHPLAVPERTVTVVDASQAGYLRSLTNPSALGDVIYQPMDRGTAAGVLLPLVTVLSLAPEAVVVITPSDHSVEDSEGFRHGLRQGIARIRAAQSDLVVFGVEPTAVTADYGWITPSVRGRLARGTFQPVAGFIEKPPLFEALQLFASGAVWNTMVLVAKATALLEHYRHHLPFLADVLTAAADLSPGAREPFLRDWYADLPRADFSRDVLTPSRPLCLYVWPADVGWSDLGTPDRLKEWLELRRSTSQARDGVEIPSGIEHVA